MHVLTSDPDDPESHVAVRYFCEDPTCDCCITEHTGGPISRTDVVNFFGDHLNETDVYDSIQPPRFRAAARPPSAYVPGGEGDDVRSQLTLEGLWLPSPLEVFDR